MGIINPSKMPSAKTITRKDDPNKVKMYAKGGESKTMVKKEIAFMKKKGAPKSMIKHEKAEAGMEAGGVAKKLPTAKQMGSLGMKKGGLTGGHKAADGVAKKGKTKTKMVAMRSGGKYC